MLAGVKRLAGSVTLFIAATFVACGGKASGRAASPCDSAGPCGASADGVCLAGTCTTRAELPGRTTTRVTVQPIALAWIGADGAGETMVPLAASGEGTRAPRAFGRFGGESDAKLLVRFVWPPAGVSSDALERIEAAYVVLTLVDDGAFGATDGLTLAATRIVEPWDPNGVTWASQPRAFDVGARPSFVSASAEPRTARVDVRAIVARAGRHDPSDQGIAIASRGGTAALVALTTLPPAAASAPPDAAPLAPPRLEVYLAP